MKLTGSIIHGAKEYHAGEDVPKGTEKQPIDLDRLKRLGLVKGEAAVSRGRPKVVEHPHGDAKHKHPVEFDDLPTTALAGIAKSHKDIDVDTSREDEAAVRDDLLAALKSAHSSE